MMEDELEQQENLGAFDDYTHLDSKLSHVKQVCGKINRCLCLCASLTSAGSWQCVGLQLASRTSLNLAKRDINEFSNLLASVEVSAGPATNSSLALWPSSPDQAWQV